MEKQPVKNFCSVIIGYYSGKNKYEIQIVLRIDETLFAAVNEQQYAVNKNYYGYCCKEVDIFGGFKVFEKYYQR